MNETVFINRICYRSLEKQLFPHFGGDEREESPIPEISNEIKSLFFCGHSSSIGKILTDAKKSKKRLDACGEKPNINETGFLWRTK